MPATKKDNSPERLTARALCSYMAQRAALEGKLHTLGVRFYLDAIKHGMRTAFGVTVSLDPPRLVSDVQNPAFFAAWRQFDEWTLGLNYKQ